jgi:uncharacterized membrane protein
MTYGTRTDHYPATSKLLHWLVAACVLITAPVAIAMTRIDKGPTQDALYNLHKSLGVLILILMVLRLINRLAAGALAPEAEIKPWQKTVSSIVHTSLYVLLLAMPVVGYIASLTLNSVLLSDKATRERRGTLGARLLSRNGGALHLWGRSKKDSAVRNGGAQGVVPRAVRTLRLG